jgi:hypothetical protein
MHALNGLSGAAGQALVIHPISIQRMVCTRCGAEANASCNCGVDYVPAKQRVAEYDKTNPGKSTRQAADDLGISNKTVSKARQAVTEVTPEATVTGRDGKKYPAKQKPRPEMEDEPEEEVVSEDYVKLLSDYWKLKDRNTALTAALNAKETQAAREWPADMKPRQIKQRDDCLKQIAAWQRALEQLYGEVTGQPSWRVEVTTKDGSRLGTGARFGTRGEAEFYT